MVERTMDPNNIRPDHLERYNFACKKLEELTEPDHVLRYWLRYWLWLCDYAKHNVKLGRLY